ncbi:TPA: LysE family transporter [Klebsiella aerogenes]|uniref:LysE family translocator n=1 Tax=Klebsiella aerogenes TaxID=548 RepID=UPI000D3CFA77|nr:LysE family transporter [Klebsiella aerogenes]EKU6672267.1 LysE family transporter [Klebsiella aerogenes]EKX4407953.1 LysE family transporter [Klebsiella aerogenes]EKZ6359378.1 LysE family transporter [Klebsiella aerogenes]MBK0621299.1 LysE family transporter [Klebsiella aerogenes]HBR6943477.1 LysE family transporter [Klebsiella aerogenes]
MNEASLLLTLAGAFLVLIISPGPNFVVITQISVSMSRLYGLFTGIGVASGSIIWALLAATGLGLIFQTVPWLQPALQLIGGLYLCWIGFKTLKSAGNQPKSRDIASLGVESVGRAYRFGLLTNLTNPKALAFYTSVFTTVTAPGLAEWVRVAGVLIIAVLAMSWFTLLATLFSIRWIQERYRAAKKGVDLFTGTVMMIFGGKLLLMLAPFLHSTFVH